MAFPKMYLRTREVENRLQLLEKQMKELMIRHPEIKVCNETNNHQNQNG